MRFLITIGTLSLLSALARYILFTMSTEWCNDLDHNYTTCEAFHQAMANKPWYVKVDEWLNERGI